MAGGFVYSLNIWYIIVHVFKCDNIWLYFLNESLSSKYTYWHKYDSKDVIVWFALNNMEDQA